jgi:hypothetical protein
MPREQLQTLSHDVDRLLLAGAAATAADEGLCRRAKALRLLGQKVPALAAIADAAERVAAAPAGQGTAPLLDLLLIVRHAQASLATVGVEGTPQELGPSGPYTTTAAAADVYALAAMRDRSGGPSRLDAVRTVIDNGAVADLRLLQPLFWLWRHSSDELADLLVEQALPALGMSVFGEIWQALRQREGRKIGWRLLTICRSVPVVGLELCRLALEEDDLYVRQAAVTALGQIRAGATFIVPALIARLRDPGQMDRHMYAAALGKIGPAARDAVPALVECLGERSRPVRLAAAEALGHMGPRAKTALKHLRAALATELENEGQEVLRQAIERLEHA